jgi:hypothetical protein
MNNDELKNIIVEEIIKSKIDQHVLYWLTAQYDYAKIKKIVLKPAKQMKKILDEFIDNIISKLPEQIITEDRIVEVLNKTVATTKYTSFSVIEEPYKRNPTISARYTKREIAQEILKGQGWEVIKGKVTKDIPDLDIYFINGKQVNSLFKKFDGKDIEVAVRECK